jgi:hypothetical protein
VRRDQSVVKLIDAAVIWTALSALVTPVVGQLLARRRAQVWPDDLATGPLVDRALAAPLDA